MVQVGVLGVPTNSSGTTGGVALAPTVLREAGLLDALERVSAITDYGDVSVSAPSPRRDDESGVIDPTGLRSMVEGVRRGVASILRDGRFPLVVGGDCPVLLGCLAAFGDAGQRGLLFVDGHEDVYPPTRSLTGEAADMELAFSLGMIDTPWWPELSVVSPLVRFEHVRALGPRDADLLEMEGVPSLAGKVSMVSGARLAEDPEGEADRGVASLPEQWWFHLDLDVLSTEALPAVDYPQAGGLDWENLELVAATALSARPVGWDVTIYNPDLDSTRVHARQIVRFIEAAVRRLT